MTPDGDKMLGIFGGMGAEAGAMTYQRLVRSTAAATDQEHIPTVVYGATTVPDRTQAILGSGKPCVDALVDGVRFLERCGADVVIVGCITAHHYIEEMRGAVSCEILSAVEETVQVIRERAPDAQRIGLLATTGTIASRIFQSALEREGLTPEILDPRDQARWVMEAIYGEHGIKSGEEGPGRQLMLKAAAELMDRDVDGLIAGCTEIPLALFPEDCSVPLFDPLDALIAAAVRACGRKLRDSAGGGPALNCCQHSSVKN